MRNIFLSAVLGVLLFSCTKSDVNSIIQPEAVKAVSTNNVTVPSSQTSRLDDDRVGECTPTTLTVPILAGQTTNAGNITATNDGTNLTVTYTTTNGWTMSQIHLYVGDLANAPQNNGGNPVPGHFPYAQSFSPSVTSYTQMIPLSTLPDCFVIAAHSVVRNGSNTQTGWGQGTQFPGNNWGMYFDYCKMTCPL